MKEKFDITIEAARVNRGLTQQELADKIGVGKTTIWKWENGQSSPSIDEGKRICEVTNTPWDLFITSRKSI